MSLSVELSNVLERKTAFVELYDHVTDLFADFEMQGYYFVTGKSSEIGLKL